jgi:2-furoyl-CoA dehydrogenase large subunit
MGEGGGAPLSTLCAAFQDALGAGGPIVTGSHNTSEAVWRLLHGSPGARGVEITR